MPNTFPKSMRLCGELRIAATRSHGKRFIVWPLRAHVSRAEGETQVMVWAPKSLHKHAVERNRLRRLMREAYRLNCEPLKRLQQHGTAMHIAIYHMDKLMSDFTQINRAMSKLIAKISASVDSSAPATPPLNSTAKLG